MITHITLLRTYGNLLFSYWVSSVVSSVSVFSKELYSLHKLFNVSAKKKKNSKQYIWCFASLDFINTALFSLHFDWKIRINKTQYPTLGCTLLIQVQCISSFRCSLRQYYKTIRFKIFFKRWEKWIRRLAATEKIIKSWRQFQRGSLLYNYN